MIKQFAVALATTVMAGSALLPTAASAQTLSFSGRDRVISNYCSDHPRADGCWDWKNNGKRWSKNKYDNWYRRNGPDVGDFAAGIFGFALGAAVVNGFANSGGMSSGSNWDRHVARCEARFQSYNEDTDRYLGFDGAYHRCTL